MLFVIGIIFSLFALIKGYTSDDRYPGYGKIDRLFKEALSAYEDAKKELIKKINSNIYTEYGDKSHIGMQNAITRIHMYYGERTKVNVQSVLGKGTTVEIHIPLDEKDR